MYIWMDQDATWRIIIIIKSICIGLVCPKVSLCYKPVWVSTFK